MLLLLLHSRQDPCCGGAADARTFSSSSIRFSRPPGAGSVVWRWGWGRCLFPPVSSSAPPELSQNRRRRKTKSGRGTKLGVRTRPS